MKMLQNIFKVIMVIGIILLLFLLASCKKETITPGNYGVTSPEPDTSHWQNGYTNGGSTPTWTNSTTNNSLYGTNWVLIDIAINYGVNPPVNNDTIHFIDNTHYKINSDTTKYNYNFYSTMGNATLTFNSFIPINGLNLTCNNIGNNAFTNVPVNHTVILMLKDLFSNPTTIYTSTFKKI